jgi:hypothetical protein
MIRKWKCNAIKPKLTEGVKRETFKVLRSLAREKTSIV